MKDILGKHKSEIPTPCLLLDVDVVDQNIKKMADFFSNLDCKLRPHAKTHKLPIIAHKQIRAGAIGITCAKLEDAKAFVEAGIGNILIANEIVGNKKIHEMTNLSRFANITVCIDDYENASDISEISQKAGSTIDVLIEVDVGLKRCGVTPGKPTLELLRRISNLKGISFKGLMGYEGGLFILGEEEKRKICNERNQVLIETVELIKKNGFPVENVSAGGSNTYNITGLCPGITDIQVGSYVTMDDWNKKYGLDFGQAITVLTTVISRPERHRVVTDAGVKAISSDHGIPRIINHEGIVIETLNEEHGKLVLNNPSSEISTGDVLEMIPSHGCTTIPLYNRYIAVKNEYVVGEFRIISGGAVY
jgi:D-serine deaminase-like pyridoxal phosphate-dependent protein